MRRKINSIFLTGLTAALVLTSCGLAEEASSSDTEVEEIVEATSQEETDVNPEQEASTPEYTLEDSSLETTEEDLFNFSSQKVTITDEGHDSLKKAVDDYYESLCTDGFEAFKEEYQEEAQELRDQGESEIRYSYDIYSGVERCDSQVLAIQVTVMEYAAGAHPSHFYKAVNFDVSSGEIIDITDLGDISSQAKAAILNQLSKSDEYSQNLFPEYEQTINNDFDDLYENFAFLLTNRGVDFLFQEYDLAPYAAGLVSFTVPYSQLDSLNTDYLPKDSFYSFAFTDTLHEMVDLNNDGTLEELYATTTYSDESGAEATIYVDGQSVTPTDAGSVSFSQTYFAHATGGNYIFQTLTLEDGSLVTYIYEVTDGINQVGKEEGKGIVSISDGTAEIGVRDTTTFEWTDIETYTY